ncbi:MULTISPECIES: PAS domain-containing sensor histidine kinase [unclassified Bradyrhizobium]|uniref:PAS domain-containing sensor histidine kinase n=1 Tax=unclassified Bradyrhizobium TaxID=2631580 RepID=UPI0004010067|nr:MULTISPECIES: PAS domain-containing protein [unclassified Bradyrhizobium]QIG94032.1 PAS domain-containing protein [Bradyrhizobium sp. 6(2017)]
MTGDGQQERQRALLDNIPDMAWLKDRKSRYLAVNSAYLKVVGLPEQEVIGKAPSEVWPPEIANVYLRTDLAVLKSGRRRRYEESRPDNNGELRWFETIKAPIRNDAGRIVGTVGISRDITERRAAEHELRRSRSQLRELSSYLQSVREEERTRISRELHDELGQTLTAMKIQLTWIRDHLFSSPDVLRLHIDRLVSVADRSVTDLRRIAADLRPIMLDELGLVSAIKWLTQNSTEMSGLDVSLSFDREDIAYSKDVSTGVFRIVQESLTNALRHGHARQVDISARHVADELQLEIVDDGRGIDNVILPRDGLGLVGMRERAFSLGGSIDVSGATYSGTRVSVRIPLHVSEEVRTGR